MQGILRNERALSPFAGIVLVLLMTFLLAGTAALFIDGLSDDEKQREAPSATLEFDYSNNPTGNESVRIRHIRGGEIRPNQMNVELQGAECTDGEDPNGVYNAHNDFGLSPTNWMKAGMSLTIDKNSPELLCNGGDLKFEDASIRVFWDNPSGSNVAIESWESAI